LAGDSVGAVISGALGPLGRSVRQALRPNKIAPINAAKAAEARWSLFIVVLRKAVTSVGGPTNYLTDSTV
jgi:hypothetical protein